MTRPTIGQRVHWPPNQCCTTEYQSSVVGRKMKPRMSQSGRLTTPVSHVVKNHSRKSTRRGARSASSAKRQGMAARASTLGRSCVRQGSDVLVEPEQVARIVLFLDLPQPIV